MVRKQKPKLSPEELAAHHAAAEGEVLSPEEYQAVRACSIWTRDDTGHDLTLEQSLFARSYIIDRNPVAAMRRLNYIGDAATLKRRAEVYLDNSEVQGTIEALGKRMMDKLEVTAEKIQERLASVAFFDPRDVMEFDHNGVQLLHSSLWPKHAAMAIQSVEMGKEGLKLKLYDSLRATELLAKQLAMLPDETTEAARAAARAAGEAVVEKLFEYFDKTVPNDPSPALPAPAVQDTKH